MGNKPIKSNSQPPVSLDLLGDIRRMIEETRSAVAVTVNAGLTMLYWRIGKRINEEILKRARATYGEQIVHSLSTQLQMESGEASPLGLILCAEGSHEQIELLRLDDFGIRVAEYLTELPPKEMLQKKLRVAIKTARAQLEQQGKEVLGDAPPPADDLPVPDAGERAPLEQ